MTHIRRLFRLRSRGRRACTSKHPSNMVPRIVWLEHLKLHQSQPTTNDPGRSRQYLQGVKNVRHVDACRDHLLPNPLLAGNTLRRYLVLLP